MQARRQAVDTIGSLLAWLLVLTTAGHTGARAADGVATHAALRVPLAIKAPLVGVAQAGQRMVTIGDYGVILHSADGRVWQQAKHVPVDTLLTATCFFDADTGWAVGHGGAILRTTDGGRTWLLRHRVDKAPALLSVGCLGAHDVIAVGAYGSALLTHDDGKSWQTLRIGHGRDAQLHLNAIVAGRPGTAIAAAESGAAFRSTDRGETWARSTTGVAGSLWNGLRLRDGGVLLFGMSGRILVSHDDGQTWQPVQSGTHEALTGGTQLDDGQIVIVGNGGVVTVSPAAALAFVATVRPDRQNLAAVADAKNGTVLVFGRFGLDRQPIAK